MPSLNSRLPQPRWSIAKRPTAAVTRESEHIFVMEATDLAMAQSPTNKLALPAGYWTQPGRFAFRDLGDELKELINLCVPRITAATPH